MVRCVRRNESVRICLHATIDCAQDHADLGATLNGFSLNEHNELASAIEKTGQAVDATYVSTTKLASPISIQ